MALGFQQGSSFLNQQKPQQNQFLTGNPSTDTGAQTNWMDPNTSTNKYQSDFTPATGQAQQAAQTNTPPSNGTALGAISAGNFTPTVGWDTSKLNDPNKHDPKYDWLRSVQQVGGNSDMQKAVDYYNQNYGGSNGNARFLGKDMVDFGGSTGSVDTLFDQEGSRQNLWAPQSNNSSFTPNQSMINPQMQNGQQQNWGQFINQMMQQQFQGQQANRQIQGQQQFNPSGGMINPYINMINPSSIQNQNQDINSYFTDKMQSPLQGY